MGINDGADEMQQFMQLTEKAVRNNEAISKSTKPDPHTNAEQRGGITHAIPRVHTIQTLVNDDRRITRNIAKDTPLLPKGVPHISFKGVEAVKDSAGRPPTQKSNNNKKQGP